MRYRRRSKSRSYGRRRAPSRRRGRKRSSRRYTISRGGVRL